MQRSMNTQRAYEADFRNFSRWMDGDPLEATPVDICQYMLDHYPALAPPTILRHIAAIRWQFHSHGRMSPTDHPDVFACRQELERRDRYRAKRTSVPIDYPMLIEMCGGLSRHTNVPKRIRDRAVLLTGWWSGLERDSLTRLEVDDVTLTRGAKVRVWQRHRRTAGARVVPRDGRLDLWDALTAWKEKAALTEGPLWFQVDRWGNISTKVLGPQSVSLIVKEAVEGIGVDPHGYSANSLRYGAHVG